jgi:hypothetical protein
VDVFVDECLASVFWSQTYLGDSLEKCWYSFLLSDLDKCYGIGARISNVV